MRFPSAYYQIAQEMAHHFHNLRPAQQRGLALWVYGTLLAKSSCQNAVLSALAVTGEWQTLRQYLREWLYDGEQKAAPCATQVDVRACYAPLVHLLLSLWQGERLALAVDATTLGNRWALLVVSVLYRGCAIPLAWQVLAGNQPEPWMPHILALLGLLRQALPDRLEVLVLADRGLWSPHLWQTIGQFGWHPLLRVQKDTIFRPQGCGAKRAWQLVPGPGHAWVGRGVAFRDLPRRQAATMVLVWEVDQCEPWVVLTDLDPRQVGLAWYGLRVWIELGFRAIKSMGWQWQRTRRHHAERVSRHWLVLAVATLYACAYGTRDEDAELQGLSPARLRSATLEAVARLSCRKQRRKVSLLRRGLARAAWQLMHERPWRILWLLPEPWPLPSPALHIVYHDSS